MQYLNVCTRTYIALIFNIIICVKNGSIGTVWWISMSA